MPPKRNEIEISIFGPGYGESILIHIGDNKWIIIDSCIEPQNKEPAALQYLISIGLNPAEVVKLIIVTHWHDDHIRGMGQIFEVCQDAEIIISSALHNDEFLSLVSIYTEFGLDYSGIDEFKKIFHELKNRSKNKSTKPLKFAVADRPLWKSKTEVGGNCTVYALSPNDAAILASKLAIGKLIPNSSQNQKGVPCLETNHAAVVLWVNICGYCILLGADLEEEANPTGGWSKIIESETRPEGTASFFKIPHHGSQNAHHNEVWQKMLSGNPVSVLTAFNRGKGPLPTEDDVKRICQYTDKAYATSIPKDKKIKRVNHTVEKTVRESSGKIRLLHPSYGYIRYRIIPNGDEGVVELFNDAKPLCSYA